MTSTLAVRMKPIQIRLKKFIPLLIFLLSVITYIWAIALPIIGDGLMHLNDKTDLSSIENIFKVFFTFDGVGKPANSATLAFHRPVFNEILVPIIKCITKDNTIAIRLISVLIFSGVVLSAYYLAKELLENEYKALLLAICINFNLTYFHGVYEFGLSMSLWVTLFFILAFYHTAKYAHYGRKRYLLLSLAFSFLTLFTKESAMMAGVALSWYILVHDWNKEKKLTKRVMGYGASQAVLLCLYLLTRYKKLGNIFTVAGGIDSQEISFLQIVQKIAGYFFTIFNASTAIIPDYMSLDFCVPIPKVFLLSTAVAIFVYSVWYII